MRMRRRQGEHGRCSIGSSPGRISSNRHLLLGVHTVAAKITMLAKCFGASERRRASMFLLCAAAAGVNFATSHTARAAGTIAFVGVIRDQTDFKKLNVGRAGYWFPQFGVKSAVAGRPTGENAREALPSWVAPLNHVASFLDPAYKTRTFSQDGPARSAGGVSTWNEFKLPSGETGRSGAIVDPHARQNSNNTVNRIQLRDSVPATFFLLVVTDNTNREHDPTLRLRLRGNTGGADIEAKTSPESSDLKFNGVADVYTFRCDGFQAGDFLKLRLSGESPGGPSLAGMMFDTTLDPNLVSKTGRVSGRQSK